MLDRLLALTLFVLAIACGCAAALLTVAGFIDYLIDGRWPDQSVLRLAYDHELLRARWFLVHDWSTPARDVLARTPAALLAAGLVAPCWWLGSVLARR